MNFRRRPFLCTTFNEAQWPIGYGVGLRIKRSSVRIRPWPLRWVLGQGSLLPLSQGEAFTLASISYLAILVKYILAKKKKKKLCIETLCKWATSVAHLTNFSFEFFYEIYTEDASLRFLYHSAKKSKMTKNSNQGGVLQDPLDLSFWSFEFLVIFDFFAPWYRNSREASSVKIA